MAADKNSVNTLVDPEITRDEQTGEVFLTFTTHGWNKQHLQFVSLYAAAIFLAEAVRALEAERALVAK